MNKQYIYIYIYIFSIIYYNITNSITRDIMIILNDTYFNNYVEIG